MSLTPVLASIDLHGYRKERAIEKVTQFLESIVLQHNNNTNQKDLWVCIITGSGSRSHDGPVLREAVRSLLNRREMQYSIQRGKGSFLINARSGHQLLPKVGRSNAVDSKVILVKDTDRTRENDVKLVRRPPPPPSHSTQHAFFLAQPLPAQVAAQDELLQKIKATSAHEHAQYVKHEQGELKKAISASQSHEERLQREEEEQLEAVLKQSQEYEQSLAQEQQEERLAAALQCSLEQEESRRREIGRLQREEEERLAVVLTASQQEQVYITKEEAMLLEHAISISQLEVSQHDKVLEEVLAQSMHDMCAVDCELEEVLKLSMRETTRNPDDLIQQALPIEHERNV